MRKEITEEHIRELMVAIPKAEEVDRLRAEVARLRADRRERIATAALQGLLSNPDRQGSFSDAVRVSVEYADALTAKLDREERKP